MNTRPPGIPLNYVQTSPDCWEHPSRIRPRVGQLQSHVNEQDTRPLVRPQPPAQARAKSVARSGPVLRVALIGFRVRILDDDNFRGGCKPVRDAIAEWLGMSDSDKNIQWSYAQCQTSGEEGLAVKIEQTTPPPQPEWKR